MATSATHQDPNEPLPTTVGDVESQKDRDQKQATDLKDTGADHGYEDGGADKARDTAQKTVDKFNANPTAKRNKELRDL